MPDNPRIVPLEDDETLWLYEATEDEYFDFLHNPALWIERTIPDCAPPPGRSSFVGSSSNGAGEDNRLLMGICGTCVVLVDGITPNIPPPLTAEQMQARSVPRSFRMANLVLPSWEELEESILRNMLPGRSPHIKFFFIEEKKRVFIHLEVGKDEDVNTLFYMKIEKDPVGFGKWLKTPRLIPRSAYKVPLVGDPLLWDFDAFKIDPLGTHQGQPQDITMGREVITPESCVLPCAYTACDSGLGTITSGTLAGGDLHMEISMNYEKAYCRNLDTGLMCSEVDH